MRTTPPAPSAADLAATVREALKQATAEHLRHHQLLPEWASESAAALDALLARAEAAERDAERWRLVACNVKDGTASAEARVAELEQALRGLLNDDELCRYPPDGDTCFCSSCKRIREARAALQPCGSDSR